MKTVSITYDLVAPGRDYKTLFDKIESLGPWCRPTESQWVVACNMSAVAIRDALVPFIDANDRLLVLALTGESAWRNLKPAVADWLRKVPVAV